MKKALAVDVGGTKIYSAIIDENGEIISEVEKYSTPKIFAEIDTITREDINNFAKKAFANSPTYAIVASQDTLKANRECLNNLSE